MRKRIGRPNGTMALFVFLSLQSLLILACLGSPADAWADSDDCLGCHAPEEDVVDEHYAVDPEVWGASIHAEMDFECSDCHEGKDDFPHEEDVPLVRCPDCHEDAAENFGGVHAEDIHHHLVDHDHNHESAFSMHDPCTNCHGVHDVRAVDDPQSRVYFRNIPNTCGQCHGDLEVMQNAGLSNAPSDRYAQSVHGLSVDNPDVEPAVCTACHGAHKVVKATDPNSEINPFNISATCGKCHEKEQEEYDSSIHGVAFNHGVMTSPICTNCHGIHTIKVVHADDADEREKSLARTTCPACHESAALMSEFDIPAARVASYKASYHGLTRRRGDALAADCASCHGIHAIFPSSDPRATTHVDNLDNTCGNCHPGARGQFSQYPVHYDETEMTGTGEIVGMWVKRIYWILLIGVLGGMLVHNIIILAWYLRKKWREEEKNPGRRRFSRSEVLQHTLFVISFILLALTGFMLAYPDSWWAAGLASIGFTEQYRRWVHRASAVVMVAVSIYHTWWILSTPYGRKEIFRIAPRMSDVREVIQNMRFHMGKSEHGAAFPKFDYPAKAEYWALVWGTVVMALTGAMLWFPVFTSTFLPPWAVKVAEIIHLFEAWLATLAILIFHFFYVIFHPEVYPLSFAMLNGRMPKRQAEHHHPRWTEDEDAPEPGTE